MIRIGKLEWFARAGERLFAWTVDWVDPGGRPWRRVFVSRRAAVDFAISLRAGGSDEQR